MKLYFNYVKVLSIWLAANPAAIHAATCGNGNRGNGICPNSSECCSQVRNNGFIGMVQILTDF